MHRRIFAALGIAVVSFRRTRSFVLFLPHQDLATGSRYVRSWPVADVGNDPIDPRTAIPQTSRTALDQCNAFSSNWATSSETRAFIAAGKPSSA